MRYTHTGICKWQFFEVMLLVTNNAPNGTSLVVSNILAGILLPAGDDSVPGSMDDPLRLAQTDQGAQAVVPVSKAYK